MFRIYLLTVVFFCTFSLSATTEDGVVRSLLSAIEEGTIFAQTDGGYNFRYFDAISGEIANENTGDAGDNFTWGHSKLLRIDRRDERVRVVEFGGREESLHLVFVKLQHEVIGTCVYDEVSRRAKFQYFPTPKQAIEFLVFYDDPKDGQLRFLEAFDPFPHKKTRFISSEWSIVVDGDQRLSRHVDELVSRGLLRKEDGYMRPRKH